MEGLERRATKLWQDLTASECRLKMFRELGKLNLGVAEIEEFNLGILSKLRSDGMKEQGEKATRNLVRAAMDVKIRDEDKYRLELTRARNLMRAEAGDLLKLKSRPYRKLMKRLKIVSDQVRNEYQIKYEKKIQHLRNKYRDEEEEKMDRVPDVLMEFESLSIFDRGKFEDIRIEEDEVLCISDG